MKKLMIATAAAAMTLTGISAPAHAERHRSDHYERSGYGGYDRYGYERYSDYDDRGRYREPRRVSRGDKVWRGRDGRYYCQRDNGTTGLIIGAAGGALVGRAIDTRGERTTGTILGAVLGGLLGQQIDKSDARCR